MTPTKTSIGDCCSKVKSPVPGTFTLPKVLAVGRWESPRRVFAYLYLISDQQGFLELDAHAIATQTGLSRKTVYKAIAFLQRVRLLFLHQSRTGRGKHSVYRLNWRKPLKKHDLPKHQQQHSKDAERIAQKKCHPSIRCSMKLNTKHPSGDGQPAMAGDIISPANRQQWNRCLKAFRQSLERSSLPHRQRRLCTALVGRHLKGKSRAYALQLFARLQRLAPKLRVPGWVGSAGELCRWFMGLLKRLLKAKPKRRRFADTNEYLWWRHSLEVEGVMRRRAEWERSWGERVQEWARQQLAELEWRRRQAELARQQLRAARQPS